MKLLLDACVLYPSVMRAMLLGAAEAGFFVPIWSARIEEEWARAAARRGPVEEAQARGEIAVEAARFPAARVSAPEALTARLWLPDENDVHVLAAAIAGSADGIVTLNAKDFPRGVLAEEGLMRHDPDNLLLQFAHQRPAAMLQTANHVLQTARDMDDAEWEMRPLLKKARLPRLAKTLQALEP